MHIILREIGVLVGRLVLCAAVLLISEPTQRQQWSWTKDRFVEQTMVFADPLAKLKTAPAPTMGAMKKSSKDGLKYVWIGPGTFRMGCSPGDQECTADEQPPHEVTISKGFWIGQTEVTVGAYKRFLKVVGKTMPPEPAILGRPLNSEWKNDELPMVNVSWHESGDYCAWIGGRLPTDAEWEYAARGANPKARDEPLDEISWYADNTGRERLDSTALKTEDLKTYGGGRRILNQRLKDNGNGMREVGRKKPNGYGLFDMLGNVWEWVNDWYDANYYQNSPSQDPPGPSSGQYRLVRGASWDDVPAYQRVSYNHKNRPELRDYTLGFRCVWEAPKP